MSSLKGAAILIGVGIATYGGLRTIDNFFTKRHNRLVMEREKVIRDVLTQEFILVSKHGREKIIQLKHVQTAMREYYDGARTIESFREIVRFYITNFV